MWLHSACDNRCIFASSDSSCRYQVIPFISYDYHSSFLRNHLYWAYLSTVGDGVYEPSLQKFEHLFSYLFLHCWVQSSLGLSDWPVIVFHHYPVHAVSRVDSFEIRYVPPNCFLVFLQNVYQHVLFFFCECITDHYRFSVIFLQEHILQMIGQYLQLYLLLLGRSLLL